ncbi:hypothetical protein MTO96_031246 [Rhipicephalus appendiculatus]
MDRHAGWVVDHSSPSQLPRPPPIPLQGRAMPSPAPIRILMATPMLLLLVLLPVASAVALPFAHAINGFTAIPWPKMSFSGFDYLQDYPELMDPDDHHQLSPSAAYASVLPLDMAFDYEPYGFAISHNDPLFHDNPYVTFNAQRLGSGGHVGSGPIRSHVATKNDRFNSDGSRSRGPKVYRITKPVKQYNKDRVQLSSRMSHTNREYDSRLGAPDKIPRRHGKDGHSNAGARGEPLFGYSPINTRLRIPDAINLLPLSQHEFVPQPTRRFPVLPTTDKPNSIVNTTPMENHPRRPYGQRKHRQRKLRLRRPQETAAVQGRREINANQTSESQTVLTRHQRESGEQDEDFMPSQYVIDLKFRKSTNNLKPDAMRSKGFTETHHRLVERFEEIHHHDDNKHDVGHSGKSEKYSNHGYHGSADDSLEAASSSGTHSTVANNDAAVNQGQKLYSEASSPKVVETAAPSSAADGESAEQTVPPVTLGKPPITVRTLLDGTGSSRGPPLTIAYRGPHDSDVHPPIPSKSFRVNDGFRRWATSKVRW